MCAPQMPNRNNRGDRDGEPDQPMYDDEMAEQEVAEDASDYDTDDELEYDSYVVNGHKYAGYLSAFSRTWDDLYRGFLLIKERFDVAETATWLRAGLLRVTAMFDSDGPLDLNEGWLCVHPACQRVLARVAEHVMILMDEGSTQAVTFAVFLLLRVGEDCMPEDHVLVEGFDEIMSSVARPLQEAFGRQIITPSYFNDLLTHDEHNALGGYGCPGCSDDVN